MECDTGLFVHPSSPLLVPLPSRAFLILFIAVCNYNMISIQCLLLLSIHPSYNIAQMYFSRMIITLIFQAISNSFMRPKEDANSDDHRERLRAMGARHRSIADATRKRKERSDPITMGSDGRS